MFCDMMAVSRGVGSPHARCKGLDVAALVVLCELRSLSRESSFVAVVRVAVMSFNTIALTKFRCMPWS